MRTSLLVQIQQDEKFYLKIWEKYLIKNAQKSFNEAKEVGVLKIESVEKEGENLKIRFKPVLDKNKMEILKKSQLKKGSDLGVLEGLDTQNEESLINLISKQNKQTSPNNNEKKEAITIKDISGDDFIIDYDPSIKEGDVFYLNYMGDLNTLKKQYSALDKTKKGLSANPNLGLILNIKENKETSDGDNDALDAMDKFLKDILLSYQTKALGLTTRVKDKVFKNDPTENQKKAIEIALNTPDIAIIQGPPGTGKTTVINAICERLFEEYPKDKNIKGQILLCAQGHDATNNARERIKVGGLPTFKFGYRNTEEQYKQNERLYEQLREFAETLIESVRKKLQSLGDYENIEKILDLEEALRRYLSSPISELEFLKEIEKNAIFFNSSMRERLSQLKARWQKQEMPVNLSVIHALRATQEGFEDDGIMRNYDLLESQFKENLTQEDRELLKSPKPNLEKLQELKIRLLEKNEEPYGLKEAMNIVLLDEMNLAHIELYFAEFLSKLEVKRSKETNISIKLGTGLTWELPLGDNLLFVGTMNGDESTKMLSDKVLDRAFCLNFERPKTLKSKQQKPLPNNDGYLKVETFNRWINKEGDYEAKLEGKYRKLTEEINKRLSACYRSIGHRVWQSMSAYMHNHPLVLHASDKDKALQFAYEECLVLKIFPKLRGVQTRNNQHLIEIQDLLKDFSVSLDFKQAMENDFKQFVFNSASYLNNAEYEKLLKK